VALGARILARRAADFPARWSSVTFRPDRKSRAVGMIRDQVTGAELTSQQKSDVDVRVEPGGAASGQRQDGDTLAKSYRYLRTAMVGLLVCLAVAVVYRSWRQGDLLGSVSAYYYTPAQAIFVGALIGLGTCMIALKRTTPVEDVFLNPAACSRPSSRSFPQLVTLTTGRRSVPARRRTLRCSPRRRRPSWTAPRSRHWPTPPRRTWRTPSSSWVPSVSSPPCSLRCETGR
jgi:hypothetical protein